jgi:hypothetical protein
MIDFDTLKSSGKLLIITIVADEESRQHLVDLPWKLTSNSNCYWTIDDLIENFPSFLQSKTVFVDDLDSFDLLTGVSNNGQKKSRNFFHAMHRSVKKKEIHSVHCFARTQKSNETHIAGSGDINGTTSLMESPTMHSQLAEYLLYRSDLVIQVQPLRTGLSSAVQGSILITTRQYTQLLQYKALDTGILVSDAGKTVYSNQYDANFLR